MTDGEGRALTELLAFLRDLDRGGIAYILQSVREEAIMVSVAVPGERWEVEFLDDGVVDVEIFRSDGEIHSREKLADLLERFSS